MMEMRPAMEGYAGIPQETRLLFRGLSLLAGVQVEGLIQHSSRSLARGLTAKNAKFFVGANGPARKLNRYSRVVVSLAEKPYRTLFDKISDYAQKKSEAIDVTAGAFFQTKRVQLSRFESEHFRDFVWRTFFSKTLPAQDFALVTGADHKICSIPWQVMHRAGLNTLNVLTLPRYPKLDTRGSDVFIAQTPFPARVDPQTRFVVRYHDAVPVLMPHTISAKSFHQASHFYALLDNVRAGAWFACVSEATRQDLLRLFPQAEPRAVTIHNMVSHHYVEENSPRARVSQIIRSRLSEEYILQPPEKTNLQRFTADTVERLSMQPAFGSLREQEAFYKRVLPADGGQRYLLMVSTIEPRKNHTRLVAAWEALKAELDPDLKLVVVGSIGWDYLPVLRAFRSWIDRGELFCLNAVPSADLRVLYRHAAVTVCPSLAEGFDFSGVEAMASGGVVASSDIPVHREVFQDASAYFDPYSTASLVQCLRSLLTDGGAEQRRDTLRQAGRRVAALYQPQRILPQWQAFLGRQGADGAPGGR
ncbi:glycosyltransferase family 1 protein [Piscinibacter sakaiensis]|nr:glycosyltransferase family 1 protein [Piscinibacter sakaiensis]